MAMYHETRKNKMLFGVFGLSFLLVVMCVCSWPAHAQVQQTIRPAVEQDWRLQEKRLGRKAGSQESLEAVVARAELLFDDLNAVPEISDRRALLRAFVGQVNDAGKLSARDRLKLYNDLRWFVRETALLNPLFRDTKLIFMERRRFICQMLHEYLGYYYDYGDIEGGGIYILESPGETFDVRELVQGRLPKGNYTTLALSYDAEKIYFAFAPRAAEGKPDFYSPERRCFHLYVMDADGSNLQQLTDGAR